METKFKVGEIVIERMFPDRKLIVSRYTDKLYYCRALESIKRKELVYFERDLMPSSSN